MQMFDMKVIEMWQHLTRSFNWMLDHQLCVL